METVDVVGYIANYPDKFTGGIKHEWELFLTNSSHSTSGNLGYHLCQTTVISAGWVCGPKPAGSNPYATSELFTAQVHIVLSFLPEEDLPGRDPFYRIPALFVLRSEDLENFWAFG